MTAKRPIVMQGIERFDTVEFTKPDAGKSEDQGKINVFSERTPPVLV